MKPNPKTQWNVGYWLLALLALVWLQSLWQAQRQVEPVAYSVFEQALAEGRVAEVLVGQTTVTGKLKNPDPGGKTVIVATRVEPDLAERLSRYDVPYTRVIESTLLRDLLSWVVPAAGVLRPLVLRRPAHGRQAGPGRLHEHRQEPRQGLRRDATPASTFADVAGVDEAKAELQEIVDFLKDPKGYGRLGARMPKGVLLVGPPGTGKTLLARRWPARPACPSSPSPAPSSSRCSSASARRACATCSSRRAHKAPAIIFIDELDALGRARGAAGPIGGHDEQEQTLNQLLVELDGFDSSSGLVLLGATNRPEILDPALLRAGRFDRQVLVDRPDKAGPRRRSCGAREEGQARADVDLEQVAALTPASPAPTSPTWCNEAALLATRRGADAGGAGRLHRGHRAHRRRPGEAEPRAQPARARDRGLPRDGPRAGGDGAAGRPTRCTRSRSSRAASARSATRSSGRPRTAS